MESLTFLDENDLKDLVPQIGIRSVLRGSLFKYKSDSHNVSCVFDISNSNLKIIDTAVVICFNSK